MILSIRIACCNPNEDSHRLNIIPKALPVYHSLLIFISTVVGETSFHDDVIATTSPKVRYTTVVKCFCWKANDISTCQNKNNNLYITIKTITVVKI